MRLPDLPPDSRALERGDSVFTPTGRRAVVVEIYPALGEALLQYESAKDRDFVQFRIKWLRR